MNKKVYETNAGTVEAVSFSEYAKAILRAVCRIAENEEDVRRVNVDEYDGEVVIEMKASWGSGNEIHFRHGHSAGRQRMTSDTFEIRPAPVEIEYSRWSGKAHTTEEIDAIIAEAKLAKALIEKISEIMTEVKNIAFDA